MYLTKEINVHFQTVDKKQKNALRKIFFSKEMRSLAIYFSFVYQVCLVLGLDRISTQF